MKPASLAERQILKAQSEGQLEGLEGEGKPLDRNARTDSDAVGLRIMAEAGALPREVELRKAVDAQIKHLSGITDEAARKAEMQKLADLQLRLNIEVEARRKFFGS